MQKDILSISSAFLAGALLAGAVSVSAFVYPDQPPPGNSTVNPVYAPLNVGPNFQAKSGPLGLCSGSGGLCLEALGDVRITGALELDAGIIRNPVPSGEITFEAPGGVTVPVLSSSTNLPSAAPEGTIIYTADNHKFNFMTNSGWVQFPSP